MKSNTKQTRIPCQVAKRILAIPGASNRIARIAGVGRSYVSMALHGTRPASEKLLDAIQQYFEASAREMSFVLGAQVVREWRNSDSQRGER